MHVFIIKMCFCIKWRHVSSNKQYKCWFVILHLSLLNKDVFFFHTLFTCKHKHCLLGVVSECSSQTEALPHCRRLSGELALGPPEGPQHVERLLARGLLPSWPITALLLHQHHRPAAAVSAHRPAQRAAAQPCRQPAAKPRLLPGLRFPECTRVCLVTGGLRGLWRGRKSRGRGGLR